MIFAAPLVLEAYKIRKLSDERTFRVLEASMVALAKLLHDIRLELARFFAGVP